MSRAVVCVGVTLVASLACTSAPSTPEPAPVVSPAPSPEPERGRERGGGGKAGKRRGRGGGDGEPQPKIPAAGVPDPLAGLDAKEICTSDELLMVKYDFDDLQSGKCHQTCCVRGAEDHWCCSLDWPFSDVPGCDAYAYMRNGLYARYGYPFSEPKWRDEFADEPYYRRREDFEPKWLSPAAEKNVDKLKQLEDDHVGCTP